MEILRLKGVLAYEGESRRTIVQGVRELFDEVAGVECVGTSMDTVNGLYCRQTQTTEWGDEAPLNRLVVIGKRFGVLSG